MTSRLKALVTGGATGIGRSAVLALARAGYDVAINYGSSAEAAKATAAEAEKLGAKTLLVPCDVADEAQMHAFTFAETPRILFPFARRVVADAVRDAGYPPLMLEPLDFNGLYTQQLMEQQAAAQGAPAGNA